MKKSGILTIIGALLLTGLFWFPLWKIMLGAPQYPEPLGMNIYINGLEGMSEFDLQNIDGLNHYIGMKTLPKKDEMWEFSAFPKIIGTMAGLGMLIGLLVYLKKISHHWIIIWLSAMLVLGTLGMYDFNQWMIDYGTNLEPHAIIKLEGPDGLPMSYKPPLFGHKKLLNFDAYSYPATGGYLMALGLFLTLWSYQIANKFKKSNR